jgi:asparagine synthase (glutamine-hydrolysing)
VIAEDRALIAAALPRMHQAQKHRGPDGKGDALVAFGGAFLGLCHQRLAILDLGPAARQPMVDKETGSILIYNGEIYNHRRLRRLLEDDGRRFEGHGDTEVLLAALCAWGSDCLAKLEGMFAFAFYDRPAQRLLLARDPLGIKPLYWTPDLTSFVFASEVGGIMASGVVPHSIDAAGMASLLAYGALQEPLTIYRDVRAFPAGSWAEIAPGDRRAHTISAPRRHWQFPPLRSITADEAVASTQEVLTRAVRSHLMSDVPVGSFLSSGIDSTVVTARAASHAAGLSAFTVAFGDHADYSEIELARGTARRLGIEHTQIDITETRGLAETGSWLATLQQPTLDGLNTFVVSKAVRQQGIVVALSGQGGDELFGGYSSFRDVRLMRSLARLAGTVPASWRARLAQAIAGRGTSTFRDKLADSLSGGDTLLDLYLTRRRLMSDKAMTMLGYPASDYAFGYLDPQNALRSLVDDDAVASISRLELTHYLGSTLLHVGDAAGMANSLEIRVPMLDTSVLNAICAIPGNLRLPRHGETKTLLRRAFAAEIGPDLARQGKRGFVLPLARWMRGPLRELCANAVGRLKQSGLCDPAGVELVWNAYLAAPETQNWSRAWMLCVLGDWIEKADSPCLEAEHVA